ncbi:diacylglycerol O-acyltransferase 1-like [Aplochiton taeniatus]
MAAKEQRSFSVSSISQLPEEDGSYYWDTSPFTAESHADKDMLCCHSVQDSLLSSDSRFTAYRGVLNWIIILLILTHAHFFLENFIQHGFLVDLRKVLEHLIEDNYSWPSIHLLLAANMFVLGALLLEKYQENGTLSLSKGHCLHLGNLGLMTLFPVIIILNNQSISTGGALFCTWTYSILGLKLYSYQETNRWYRLGPASVLVWDLYYFLLAPTLCYQREYPHTPRIRINKVLQRMLEMVILAQIMVGIVQQWIEPIFQRSENYFSRMDITTRVEQLVGLAAPVHFLCLLFFFLLHSYLNFSAELLCFGDRHFYRDWWNATTLKTFWKNWNVPLEKWSHRHIYTPLVEKGVSPLKAELLVFLMSAALCECVVALPLHNCHLWIFLVMVFELLVDIFLGRYFRGNYGNGLVWLCLLLGPPLAVMTYFHDHYISLHHPC